MGACNFPISGIMFESSGQPFLYNDGDHRSHLHACSTGQRLHCPDDSTCLYSTSDKSALLRHRQRNHGYQAKPTASKDRYMNVTKKGIDFSARLDNESIVSSSSSPLEHATNWSDPCCSSTVSSRQAYGASDETNVWHDDHASPQATMTKQPVESIEQLLEGRVTSRFPTSFARTRLLHSPKNGTLSASKRCRCPSCTFFSIPALVAYSNSTVSRVPRTHRGVKVREAVLYKRGVSYPVKESVCLATC